LTDAPDVAPEADGRLSLNLGDALALRKAGWDEDRINSLFRDEMTGRSLSTQLPSIDDMNFRFELPQQRLWGSAPWRLRRLRR
jgi:hypothetical protein